MSKLSESQIAKALEIMRDTCSYSEGIIKAAPFLQYPIADPTGIELVAANQHAYGSTAIRQFVRMRNIALLPAPTKREKIEALVKTWVSHGGDINGRQLTSDILALDEPEVKR